MSRSRPTLAVYLSGHGFGHLTRTSAFLERLLRRMDCELEVVAACPREAWPSSLAPHTRRWRSLPCDAGVAQADELTVDRQATLHAIERWQSVYASRVDEEARSLRAATAVLADVPPLAFDAALVAERPTFALANFSWDWIYAHMGFAEAAANAARAYGSATALLALEPAAPMSAFHRSLDLGVLGRLATRERGDVRVALGVSARDTLVLIAFREPRWCVLPAPLAGVRFAAVGNPLPPRPDVVPVPPTIPFVDVVSAADAVVAKAGYGMIGDIRANGTRLLYCLRQGFPEDEVLDRWLTTGGGAARVERRGLETALWWPAMEALLRRNVPPPSSQAGIEAGIELVAAALSA